MDPTPAVFNDGQSSIKSELGDIQTGVVNNIKPENKTSTVKQDNSQLLSSIASLLSLLAYPKLIMTNL